MSPLPLSSYQIGIVCALPKEMVAVLAMLDEEYEPLAERDAQDHNTYILGRIHKHNVVVACLPAGIYGTNAAAIVANNMLRSFPSVRIGLMVGIGGAIPDLPKTDIRLGDVVVSQPDTIHGGVVQYDLGKSLNGGGFERKGSLDKPPMILLTALSLMQVKCRGVRGYIEEAFQRDPTLSDRGYASPSTEEDHLHCAICDKGYSDCKLCVNGLIPRKDRKRQDPVIHYGTIASGNQVVKDAALRDQLGQEFGAKCVEMEAAGLMNNFPCLIVRGICDYSDSYKNDEWQEYAALTAAACAKELLSYVTPEKLTMEKSLDDVAGVLKHQVNISKEVLDETKQQSRNGETRHLNDMHRACHQAFKTTAYEEFKNINPRRVPGTCEWALKHPAFLAWCSRTGSDLLWISADPGCGKSVLARSLIDIDCQSNENHKVCYFFFKDNEVQNNLSAALCAVLHQLFAFAPHLIAHAMPAWEKNGDKPLTKEVDEMWRIFLAAVTDPHAPNITCVFDALDECQEIDRRRLIGKLTDFYKTTSSNGSLVSDKTRQTLLKFLVTSRPYDDIRLEFELPPHFPSIQLRGEEENKHIRQEINIVIKTLVSELAANLHLKEGTKDRLETQLLEMEHHTYLWLHLAIKGIYETFRDSFRPDEESIDRLPTGIEDAYERILSKASKRTQNVKLILQIIVGAKRALTVGEMAIALGVASKPQATTLKDAILDKQNLGSQVRHWCGLFVFISDSRIYLIHQTAKEFLIRVPGIVSVEGMWKNCLVPAEYEVVMAQVCVRLLLCPDIASTAETLVRRFDFSGFARGTKDFLNQEDDMELFIAYSAEYWAAHVQSTYSSMDKSLKTRVLQLYDSENAVSSWWKPIFWGSFNWFYQGISALCFAALNGHVEIVCDFLSANPSSIDWQDSTGYPAVIHASQFGRLDVVELLLNKGANLTVRGRPDGMTAFLAASQKGHLDVVELLLSRGANVNEKDIHNNTALHMSSKGGHYSVVELLLDKGADVNAIGVFGQTALYFASEKGRYSVVELLLSRGADITTRGFSDETALHMACEEGHLAVVELLISRGALVNTRGCYGETPLCTASKGGHLVMVELLLNNGADVNARGSRDETPLYLASKECHLDVIELLLSKGADANCLEGYLYKLILDFASYNGRQAIVDLLTSKGTT